jgi:hypothetical protein
MLSSFDKVFLVIDALDECRLAERASALSRINERRAGQPGNHVLSTLITSRRNIDIEELLISLPTVVISI